MRIGIIKERKSPPDERVPFTPKQCLQVIALGHELVVEKSGVRCFQDAAYTNLGIKVVEDVSDCEVLMGVKEVPVEALIPNKKYFFFSHTIKKQAYNQKLLRALLDRNIQMIDYECLVKESGSRILGFGKHAGIVGAYNALLTYGKKQDLFDLKPAYLCNTYQDLIIQLKAIPKAKVKIVISGTGRVGKGAKKLLTDAGLMAVEPGDFTSAPTGTFTCLEISDLYHNTIGDFNHDAFFVDSSKYESKFAPYLKQSDIFISAHYWDNKSAPLFSWEDIQQSDNKCSVIADITCDIKGSVPTTLRASTIADPIYGIDPATKSECDYKKANAIAVMAVDNLPCELPADASEDFGNALLTKIIPEFNNFENSKILNKASICKNGQLTPKFSYLKDFSEGR